jgi:S-DNA-T family DNA segregation ATPase FtsK/SpoIIIE
VVQWLKAQGQPDYRHDVTQGAESEDGELPLDELGGAGEDDLYSQAVAIVLKDRRASTSYIQRRLQIGYNRAATVMERMEDEGIVGPANHAGKREILIPER